MSQSTTIQLDKKIVKELREAKEYPEQTYNTLIKRMIEIFSDMKKNDQYDNFLHYIQKQKMRELWDNKHDEAWEHA